VVVLLARRGRITSWPTLAWLAVFAVIGAYAIRGVAWWPLGAAVAVAGVLAADVVASRAAATGDHAPARRERRSVINVVLAIVIAAACLVLVPFWRPIDPGTGAPTGLVGDAPSGITSALQRLVRPGDHVLNPQPWGSWFEFAVPGALYTLDSRIELFPPSVWDDYDTVWKGTAGWQDALARWQVNVAVTTKDDHEVADRLTAAGWHVAYSDADGSILTAP
jgi:hypothetical protein